MTLVCVVALWASSLAQITADLGQNNPSTDQVKQGVKGAKLQVRPPAPSPSPISVPTVLPAAVPPPPSTSPISSATPNQLYKTPRQQGRDSAVAELPEIMGQSLRADLLPDTVGAPASPPTSAQSQMEGMPYEFVWSVQDGTSGSLYRHEERSDGNVAQGEYRVLLPDGRLQVVTFTDRGQGYEAQVVYQDYDGF
ncbi:uncharacterized protein [Panulirus ornatus]|uniref:uncharacterized protein n=1 Tax=Panulirus ornatus TaxID=150431 RepID=UPI003A84590F